MQINQLADLNRYKTAPKLDFYQAQKLSAELDSKIEDSDWITIGVMAKSDMEAKTAFRTIIKKYLTRGTSFDPHFFLFLIHGNATESLFNQEC